MTTPVPITSRTGMFRGNSVDQQSVIDLQGLITQAATQVTTCATNATAAAASAASAATQVTNVNAAVTSGVANINAAVTSGSATVAAAAAGVNSSVTVAVSASTSASGSATSATASATAAASSASAASTSATAAAGSATAASTSASNAGSSATAAANSATNAANSAALLASSSNIPYNSTPTMNGTGAVGTSGNYSRGDHVHPTDTSRAPVASPTFTGTVAAPTINATSALTVGGVAVSTAAASSTTPLINGTAAIGTGTTFARADHVHPTDTTRAALASPNFTGTPQIAGVNVATQSYVTGLASSTTPVVNGTAAIGVSTNYARADHVHGTDTSRAPVANAVFTGTTTLAADPASALQASTKQYVDNTITSRSTQSFRNVLFNAGFRVNQRNPGTVTVAGTYPVDRWLHADDGTGSRSLSQYTMTDADRTAIGDEEARFGVQIVTNGGAGAGAFDILQQRIEGVRTLAGKTATISFWAVATAGSSVGVELSQTFGTGGSPSAAVTGIGATKVALTTSWARYTVTVAVPALTGKTLGTNGDDYLTVSLWTSSGTTFAARNGSLGVQTLVTTTFWGVQLEVGSVATPLEKVANAVEVANCQRFYAAGVFNLGGSAAASGAGVYYEQALPVSMRAVPTIVISSVTALNCASAQGLNPNPNGFTPYAITSAAGAYTLGGAYTATAEL